MPLPPAAFNGMLTQLSGAITYVSIGAKTTLTAAATANATIVSLQHSVAVGDQLAFDRASASEDVRIVKSVTGTGPYSATVDALTYAHASGSDVAHAPVDPSKVRESSTSRVSIAWTAASNGDIDSSGDRSVPMAAGSSIGSILFWSASTGGTFLGSGLPTTVENFGSTGSVTVKPSSVALQN